MQWNIRKFYEMYENWVKYIKIHWNIIKYSEIYENAVKYLKM